jgi:hypothetical protein
VRHFQGLCLRAHLRETEPDERCGELFETRKHRRDVEIVVGVARDEGRPERDVDGLLVRAGKLFEA